MKSISKLLLLFLVGGVIYYSLELLWRGYSHGSMFVIGGLAFISLGLINEILPWDFSITTQSLIGSVLITLLELVSGLILNVHLQLGVWDYSHLPYNFMGQICLAFFLLWWGLSIVGIVLDDFLRYRLFKEEKPHYHL